jgi:beta-glucosidase
VAPGEGLEVSVDIVNTGSRRGAEVVQVYVRDVECRLPRPPKELKAFTKVELEPGERRRVTLPLGSDTLQFYDPALARWAQEPGEFEVLVAASAVDVRLRATFVLTG